MMHVVDQAVLDENAAALGVPRKQLMESSGNAVASVVRDLATPGDSVAIVAGRGNNGGDGFVAARFLEAFDVSVHLLGRAETITTDIASQNWDALQRADIAAREVRDSRDLDLGDPDLVVDAMLGTGITGELREPEASAAVSIDQSNATVVAVDVPSGVDADTGEAAGNAVTADHVVTFHETKPGLADVDAEVTVADIGIPEAAELFVERGDLLRLSRDPQSHKGDHGEVLVVGGGPYTGAPALTAQAAFRAGADLVRVACPKSIAREVQSFEEGIITRPFAGEMLRRKHVDQLLDIAVEQDAVVLGPGLGDANATLKAVREFLAEYDGTVVVDADALQVVPEVETDATLLCTPHQGELRKMGGETDDDWRERMNLVESFAAELDATLLVKGAYDVISDGETTRANRTGNPGMTVGGTGDVLAGISGALASVIEPQHAAAIAAYVNGSAGDIVVDEYGHGLVASDLLDAVPAVMWGESDE
jgi:NAD(P)H-hydrate epimerase